MSADRSTCIQVENSIPFSLSMTSWNLQHGIWSQNLLPPDTIGGGSADQPVPATWQSESQGLATGTQGEVIYTLSDGETTVTIDWDNPYWGSNQYSVTFSGPLSSTLSYTGSGGSGDNTTYTITLNWQG